MPFVDFVAGYTKAALGLALLHGDIHLIRREVGEGELGEEDRTKLLGGLAAFWSLRGADIDAATGPPGLTRHVSWHAGREFAHLRMRQKAELDPDDFSGLVRTRLRNAATALPRLRFRLLNDQVTLEEYV